MADNYKKYFDIDSEYFPAVNEEVIEKNPDLWLKFYPHETFVNLMKKLVNVLDGDHHSLWVEGSYGTGKSHAVLTLKKLIDADDDQVRRYFEEHKDILDNALLQKILGVKHHGRILTVHRYGSSSIRSDAQLVLAMQESIDAALKREGLANPLKSYRDRIQDWLSDPAKKAFVNSLIQEKYRDEFSGENIDEIISHLQNYDERNVELLIHKLIDLGDREGFRIFTLNVESMLKWIDDIVVQNQLKSIVFIWDEFTEFFLNNCQSITGFQRIADYSGLSNAFKLLIVTHKTQGLFSERDTGAKKIFDRFSMINIELPEHMAFKLLGAAMKKTSVPKDLQDWQGIVNDLYGQTSSGRELIMKKAHVDDDDLKNILPMHPYTAIVLKYIASTYISNQRSMFDFIKNDANREFNGFKWFIDTAGPLSAEPLFTVDMLWDFFYEKGKQNLSNEVRSILDYYELKKPEDVLEQRILKTVLMLQGINKSAPSELFLPTLKNLTSALEGSPKFRNGNAERILETLCASQILFKNKIGRAEVYNAMVANYDADNLNKEKSKILAYKTEAFLDQQVITKNVKLPSDLGNRFGSIPELLTQDSFRTRLSRLDAEKAEFTNKIELAMTIAKNDDESSELRRMIREHFSKNVSSDVVIVETCNTAFGMDAMDQYADAKARAELFKGKDKGQAAYFENEAGRILVQWYDRIENGEYIVYSKEHAKGERAQTKEQMQTALRKIIRNRYPNALELSFKVTDTLWNGNPAIKVGAKVGLLRKLGGCYTTAKKDSPLNLERQLADIWNVSDYWEHPQTLEAAETICEMKKQLIQIVERKFESGGRISIREIVEFLRQAPFGLTICNMSSFALGFLLKEYANQAYSWSDGTTNDAMTEDKLAQMIDGAFKYVDSPSPRYRDEYIVRDKEEIRQFGDAMTTVFDIERSACGNIDSARAALRDKMKKLFFPIWCLKANLEQERVDSSVKAVTELIDRYVEFGSNNGKFGTDNDIASDIGMRYMTDKTAFFDLKKLLKPGKLRAGMVAYVMNYKTGELPKLARTIGDENEDYINELKKKFDASDANWVWREETVQQKIDELLVEYSIVEKSRLFVPKTNKFVETMHYWREKRDELRVPYLVIQNEFQPELVSFLKLLYELPSTSERSVLTARQLDKFNALLEEEETANEIKDFFMPNTQVRLFRKVLNLEVPEFTEENVQDLFEDAEKGVWQEESVQAWINRARAKISQWKRNSARSRLMQLWCDKTGTDTPMDWSTKYQMSILAMIEDSERDAAEKYFQILNDDSSMQDEKKLEAAMNFIGNASFYDRLSDESLRDDIFREKILKKYQYVLKDLLRIRELLMNIEKPYRWWGSPKVDEKIRSLAEIEYKRTAFEDANRVVDGLSPEELKRYLKELIRNNAEVGIEIIRHQ